ncbi:MAG: hypothetical protein LAP86_20305 [Acidobacteriia bacterium]|nr:hypothetical protein [Terriglobia bacterium]
MIGQSQHLLIKPKESGFQITRRDFFKGSSAMVAGLAAPPFSGPPQSQELLPAAPILLLPLRMEYRVIPPGARLKIALTNPTWASSKNPQQDGVKALAFKDVQIQQRELWVRWYFDDSLHWTEPESETDEEVAAIDAYRKVAGAHWWDNPSANEAWQTLVAQVGFHRALHLQRSGHTAPRDTQPKCGILGLPRRIGLYGLMKNGELALIGQSSDIAQDVAYSPACLNLGGWLSDFDAAVKLGMGLRLTGSYVDMALTSEWIIAVGLGRIDAAEQLKEFIEDKIAAGEIDFIPQDAPTNTSPRQSSAYRPWVSDPVAGLREACYFERKCQAAATDDKDACQTVNDATDADVLANALAVDSPLLYKVRNAEQQDESKAKAMARVLLPFLTAGFDWLAPSLMDPRALADYLANNAFARGPLPAMRVDRNPYGILPILIPSDVEAPGSAPVQEQKSFNFVRRFCDLTLKSLDKSAVRLPVMHPGSPNQGEVLRRILQVLPVSPRIDGTDKPKGSSARPVVCPLVGGITENRQPAQYLKDLLRKRVSELELGDPEAEDRDTPLLYRLVLLALSSLLSEVIVKSGKDVGGLPDAIAVMANSQDPNLKGLRERVSNFSDALSLLASTPDTQLEVLLLEMLDLVDHRTDAWQTSLAAFRLSAQRRAGNKQLLIGYYGMIGKLRTESATGDSDGYVIAPSIAQATTAGILRSAAIRFGGDKRPFQLNLCSRRVRKALRTLNALRKGIRLNEILGYHAERWLHDRGQDALIYEYRTDYSVARGLDNAAALSPLLDGEKLLANATQLRNQGDGTRREEVIKLLDELQEEKDAFCDLVVAESVHQLALGNTAGVSAWMQCLSGGMPPGEVEFVRIRRNGQSSPHRVLFIDSSPIVDATTTNPRIIAEPLLAKISATAFSGFDQSVVQVTVSNSKSPEQIDVRSISLKSDLGLDPVDILLGGQALVKLLSRAHIVGLWEQQNSELSRKFGPLPDRSLDAFLNQECPLSFNLAFKSGNVPSVAELLDRAMILRQVISQSRAITPTDLQPLSDPSKQVDLFDVKRAAVDGLLTRVESLLPMMDPAGNTLKSVVARISGELISLLGSARTIGQEDSGDQSALRDRDKEIEDLRKKKAALETDLRSLAKFGLPEALRLHAIQEIIANPDAYARYVQEVLASIEVKRSQLGSAEGLQAVARALQTACDGEALPIWPPYSIPISDFGTPAPVADILERWQHIQKPLVSLYKMADCLPLEARVSKIIKSTNPDDARRDNAKHPETLYVGSHLLLHGANPQPPLAGFVAAEWAVFKPSSSHTGAIAINRDAPQCQAPNAFLLGVAANDRQTAWSEEQLALLVKETIRLLRIRSLSSMEGSITRFGLRAFSLVPAKGKSARIPLAPKTDYIPWAKESFGWQRKSSIPKENENARSIIERNQKRVAP